MKLYSILGYITGIGGWQVYINNKIKYLKSAGWEACALGIDPIAPENSVELEEIKNSAHGLFFELAFYPGDLNSRQRARFVERVAAMIGEGRHDEIVFEATTEELLLWAEFLASEFGAKSICVNVKNRFPKYNKDALEFFRFKKERGEFLMMIKNGFNELFDGYCNYEVSDDYVVSPLTYNMYRDDGKDYRKLFRTDEFDFVIGTAGWLNKQYYPTLAKEVKLFAEEHADKKILFIVIGSSVDGSVEKVIARSTEGRNNLMVCFTGVISPLPSNLIRLFDACIASYGCAIIADKLNVKTIMMDDDCDIPLGIMGYTLRKWPYTLNRTNTDKPISEMLNDVLTEEICTDLEYSTSNYGIDAEHEIQKQLDMLKASASEKKYYNILLIKEINSRKKKIVFLSKIIGIRNVENIMRKRRSCHG